MARTEPLRDLFLALSRGLVEPPHGLAALRIVVSVVILLSPELRQAVELAADPFQTDVIPEGLATVSRIPVTVGTARFLQICAISSGVTALLGYWSRLSSFVLTLSGGLVFSLSQRSGAVIHDMHLFWFTALLSASRCGDAWSFDAWGKAPLEPSLRYGAPAAMARAH